MSNHVWYEYGNRQKCPACGNRADLASEPFQVPNTEVFDFGYKGQSFTVPALVKRNHRCKVKGCGHQWQTTQRPLDPRAIPAPNEISDDDGGPWWRWICFAPRRRKPHRQTRTSKRKMQRVFKAEERRFLSQPVVPYDPTY